MELEEFLQQTKADVAAQIGSRLAAPDQPYPFPEFVFCEIVMQHMADVGMTFDPVPCHFTGKVGNANLKLSGYALSEEADQLDLFVSCYADASHVEPISETETKKAAEQCFRFLANCASGKLSGAMDASSEAYELAVTIEATYADLDQVRIYVLTDRQAKSKSFKSREVGGKTIKLEVMDIERLFRHWAEGKPRDELTVDFTAVSGAALPCVYVPGQMSDYDYALTALPAQALYFLYEKYGQRLLEANVRSFLSVTGKVNRGIRDTLRDDPEHFMAYNNGIVIVADEVRLGQTPEGGTGITWMKGLQIVNGGQTTASIYFTKKKNSVTDLSLVRVPAKVIVLKSDDPDSEERLIADISRYANSQNAVKQSDLSANKPFHVRLEQLSQSVYCPDGVGRWFYERAAGSYKTMLARDGNTPAKLKRLRSLIVPPARKLTKTDLAKFLTAWDQRPDMASLGGQKNFVLFMEEIATPEMEESLDAAEFKRIIAKVIVFKKVQSLVRPMFAAFRNNVVIYLIAVLANTYGDRIDFEKIWLNQDISDELRELLKDWATIVNQRLEQSAKGRMISEWAKKPECWGAVRAGSYTWTSAVPELV